MSVYLRIQEKYESFTKSEKRVARQCLDNYLEIGDLTVAQLAELAQCGEATIFRFCQKIGFESYHDFKSEISEEVHDNLKLNENSFITDVYQSVQDSIEFTIQNLDQQQFEEVAHKIFHADKVFCSGVGNSGIPAEACAMRFLRNGKNGIFIKDNHFQLIYLYQITDKDVAILFSTSGESYDTINCAEILKKRGIPIVSITSSVVSTLAKMSDYHILLKRHIGPVGAGSMIAQITEMYIADLITTRVGMLNQKDMMKAKEVTYDYVINKSQRLL